MNQPTDQWRNKYLDNLAELERKELAWGEMESTLKRCISRLTFIGDGKDKILDRRLEELRNQVRGTKDMRQLLRMVETIVEKAEGLQKSGAPTVDEAELAATLVKLSKDLPLPKNLRGELKSLTSELKKSPPSPQILERLFSLVNVAMKQQPAAEPESGGMLKRLFGKGQEESEAATRRDRAPGPPPAPPVIQAPTPAPEPPAAAAPGPAEKEQAAPEQGIETAREPLLNLMQRLSTEQRWQRLQPLRQQAQTEADSAADLLRLADQIADVLLQPGGDSLTAASALLQLTERLDLPTDLQPRATQLKARLVRKVDEEALPAILEELVTLVGTAKQQAEKERQEVEAFLLQLTDRLQLLDLELEGIGEDGQQIADGSRRLGESVDSHVNDLHTSLAEATDLQELKLVISQRLSLIQERMREHRGEEEERIEALEQRIDKLKGQIGEMEQESAVLRKHVEDARAEAYQDALTGLNNRHAFDQRLEQEYARWKRYQLPVSLIVCDVDRFKQVNDRFGHQAGDKVLQVIGSQIAAVTREVDFPARYGGEEFVILLPETDREAAMAVADKVRMAIQEKPFHSGEKRVNITASFGIAQLRPGDEMDDLFKRADKALYRAKQSGRNRCEMEGEDVQPEELSG